MRRLKIIFICKLTICLLTWSVFVAELDALRGSAVVLQARAKADKKISDPDEAIDVEENGEQAVELNVTTTTKPTLTGIPQIDYVHDPNLPRELNGYNLSDYPFLNSVPADIEFKCDGLHDGFYASMPHKCQLYHHCLFGTRFDFLCANYTAFDQKTFICHFVSQVDCPNSAKYFSRNDALYKAAETTTLPTTTTSTTAAPQQQQQQQPQQQQQQQQQQQPFYPQYQQQQMPYEGRRAMPPGYAQGRKRRPSYRRRRPVYEYYYVDDYDDQQEYYDDSVEQMPVAKKPIRKHSRFNNYKQADLEADYQESSSESDAPPSGNFKQHRGQHAQQQQHQQQQQQQQQQPRQQQQPSSTAVTKNVSNQISSVYDKPRAPPKIRRPVPINERDRYDYVSKSGSQPGPSADAAPASTTTTTTTTAASTTSTTTDAAPARSGSKGREPLPKPVATEDPVEYYDDDEEVVSDDEYAVEPDVPAAVKSAVASTAAASKPDQVLKPIKAAAARTAMVVDYDVDRARRPPAAARSKPGRTPATVAPAPQQPAAPRKRPTADRVADDYEDELPVAATRQSINAATKQRASGPFLMRPSKPAKVRAPPVADDDDGAVVDESAAAAETVYQQQARQPQRVSVRQVMAAPHNNRQRPQQQQQADRPHAQYNNNNKHVRATSAANRRPMRPVYEYADEYYDE